MESSDESKKEEEANIYLIKNQEKNEINDLTSCFTYFKLFFKCKKLNSESSNLKEIVYGSEATITSLEKENNFLLPYYKSK